MNRDVPFDDLRRHAVQEYAGMHADLRAAGEQYVVLIRQILDDGGINYLSVEGRTKSVQSFAAKAIRMRDGAPMYADPLHEITDTIGVRVITYLYSDVAAVAELLADQMRVLDDRDLGQETASEGRFGYASRHLLVALDDESNADAAGQPIHDRVASVQLRTVLQHAWAEFEHDIRYKGNVPVEQAPDLDRRFTLAAGLLELADREFSMIRDRLQVGMGAQLAANADGSEGDPRISAQDLAAFLAGLFPEAGWSRTDHYTWISSLLLELGVVSLEELEQVMAGVDDAEIEAAMGYKYPPGAVRRLDDALLMHFGEAYVGLLGNSHRADLLEARLRKLDS
jgi:ppGpp synthetase/RelA/SpoT-type nucleotidyltranferase